MSRVKNKAHGQNRLGINAKIDLPTIKLEVKSNDAVLSLREIRKIIESVHKYPEPGLYDFNETDFDDRFYYDIKFNQLSRDFNNNHSLIKTATTLSDAFHDSRVRKASLATMSEINMDEGKVEKRLGMDGVKRAVKQILGNIDKTRINNILVHIMGDISKKDAGIIVDQLKSQAPNATINSVFKNKKMPGKVSVEAVLFGDFGIDLSDDRWDSAAN